MSRLVVLLTAIAIALLTSDLARANPADDGPKKVALLVGVNRYKTRILIDKPLQFAREWTPDELVADVKKLQG